MTDKQHLEAMLTALDASPRALERPMCRGWIGDWQISGSDGHIMTDGRGFVFYISTESPRRWTGIKKLSFASALLAANQIAVINTQEIEARSCCKMQ